MDEYGVSKEELGEILDDLLLKIDKRTVTVKDMEELPLPVQEYLGYRITEQLRDIDLYRI